MPLFKCQYRETEVGKVKIGNHQFSVLLLDNTFLNIYLYGIENNDSFLKLHL